MVPVLIAAGVLLLAAACDDDKSSGDDTEYTPPSRDTDAGELQMPDAGTTPDLEQPDAGDPCVRNGFSLISELGYSEGPCPVGDMYITGDRLVGMCTPPSNRLFTANINASDPMSGTNASMGDRVSPTISGRDGSDIPSFVQECADGSFFISSTMDTAPFESTVTLISPSGDTDISSLPIIENADSSPICDPVMAYSGFVEGSRAYVAASDALEDNSGVAVSYPFRSNGNLDLPNVGTPVPTGGRHPIAMTKLNGSTAAVINESCDDGSPCAGLVDFSDPASPAFISATPLGIPDVPTDSHRIAKTEDNRYIVTVSSSSGEMSIFDTQNATVRQFSFNENPSDSPAKFVAVQGMKAYISATDRIFVVNFSDLNSLRLEKEICVGRDLGPIAVHSSGKIFVAVTNWCGEGASEWSDLVAIDPDSPALGPCAPVVEEPDMGVE